MSNTSNISTSESQEIISYFCLFVASIFFGGNYLPVKYFETGDGVFFQLIVCLAIWFSGFILHVIKGFPQFYALPLIGGFIWTTGNINSMPIIKCLGIGLGSLFWNIVGLLVGWAQSRYGWFGVTPEVPTNITLNYIGIIFCTASIILFLFVKTEVESSEEELLISDLDENGNPSIQNKTPINQIERDFYDKFSTKTRKIFGTILSIFTGIMFGLSLAPILYIINNYKNSSSDYNDYAFSYTSGIFLGSLFYFVIYCIIKKNKPNVYPEAILPGFIVGLLWLIANTCFFIATNNLSQAITFPIACCGPCSVAFIIGIAYKEIKGRKNFFIIFLGILTTLIGSVLVSVSK